jgi:hypothetical protein
MVLPETIHRSITKAGELADVQLLQEAHASIHKSLASGSRDRAGLKLILQCAETALHLGGNCIPLAEDMLKQYDLEARRFASSGERLEGVQGRNQYWIRCQYAKGLLQMEHAKGLKGPPLVTAVLESIAHMLVGLEEAISVPRSVLGQSHSMSRGT